MLNMYVYSIFSYTSVRLLIIATMYRVSNWYIISKPNCLRRFYHSMNRLKGFWLLCVTVLYTYVPPHTPLKCHQHMEWYPTKTLMRSVKCPWKVTPRRIAFMLCRAVTTLQLSSALLFTVRRSLNMSSSNRRNTIRCLRHTWLPDVSEVFSVIIWN